MNAQTYTHVVNPVLSVFATPKQQKRSKQEFQHKQKKNNNFDDLFFVACETTDDDMLHFHDTGCYGKDAQLVVGIVSSFNRTL